MCGGTHRGMSLDPLEFFNVAKQVAQAGSEAALRTAVGRTYYAAFLVARERTGIRKRKGRKSVHQLVIDKIRKREGYKTTGDALDDLFWLRIQADYFLVPETEYRDWVSNWSRAQGILQRILPKLQRW